MMLCSKLRCQIFKKLKLFSHTSSLTNLGSLLGNLHDHPGAIDMYRRALLVDPAMWPAK